MYNGALYFVSSFRAVGMLRTAGGLKTSIPSLIRLQGQAGNRIAFGDAVYNGLTSTCPWSWRPPMFVSIRRDQSSPSRPGLWELK